MFYRFLSAINSRTHQVYQIASWRRPKLSKSNDDDCNAYRRGYPRIRNATTVAIELLTPKEVGTLTSVLHKCVFTLAIFKMQQPTDDELWAFEDGLEAFLLSRCPNIGMDTMRFGEMSRFLGVVMRLQCAVGPTYAAVAATLRTMPTYSDICDAAYMSHKITTRISLAIFHGMLPLLHEKYNFRQMVAFSRAYRREDCHLDGELPLPLRRPTEFNIDHSESEYQGVGERVELSAFCKTAGSIPKDIECSVCVTEIDGTEQDPDEQPVVTKCGHLFHVLCLDKWVNESGMKTSNTCPTCRTVLCEPRERLHTSIETEPVAEFVTESRAEEDTLFADGSSLGWVDWDNMMPDFEPGYMYESLVPDRYGLRVGNT